jgi:hypothetical protein
MFNLGSRGEAGNAKETVQPSHLHIAPATGKQFIKKEKNELQ